MGNCSALHRRLYFARGRQTRPISAASRLKPHVIGQTEVRTEMGRGRPECLSSGTRTCRLRRQDVSRHCWVWAARRRMRIDGDGGSRRDRSFQRSQGSTGSSSSRPEPTDLSLFEPRMQPAPQAQPKKGRNSQASSRRWQGNCCAWASPRAISCSPCCRCPWITCCWNTAVSRSWSSSLPWICVCPPWR